MSTSNIATSFGFDTRDFWIANSGDSTNEHFSGLVSSSGGPLSSHQERTYSTFEFEANGLTYRYTGSFTFTADFGLLDGTVTATGTYNQVDVLVADQVVASYNGPSRSVDFGTYQGEGILDLRGNLLNGVTDLLFGPDAQTDAYGNLHTDATANLPQLAYADGVTAKGGDGDDILTGGAAADVFDGGGGNDRMFGYGGDDIYTIRNIGDRAIETAGDGEDSVRSEVSYSLNSQHIERLTLLGNTDINGTGNQLDNVIIGNVGDNVLKGGSGEDLMRGRTGDDEYVVNSAGDTVVELTDSGQDAVKAVIDYTLAANVEELILAGVRNIDGTGNILDNRIVGNAGNNAINGRDGADVLRGNGGADRFVFDTHPVAGNVDRIVDFTTADTIVLDNSVFTALSLGGLDPAAFRDIASGSVDAGDRILYNHNNGALFYDANGSGLGQRVQIAILSGHPGLAADDFLIV